jgi:hypothetical protein
VVRDFDVNVIVVVEDDNLFHDLVKQYHPQRHVLMAKKVWTIEQEDKLKHAKSQNNRALWNYFRGAKNEISATPVDIPYDKFKLY